MPSVTIEIFKDTNFGNNELVWNVPASGYNFNQHDKITYSNVNMRFPLLTTRIVVNGDYRSDMAFFDYMRILDNGNYTYYFINTIVAERNILIFSVTLDVITTHNVLSKPITGVLVRKHDTNNNETKFDYPTALSFEGNYVNDHYTYVGYDEDVHRFIESTINLSELATSTSIESPNGEKFVVPVLPKPTHVTEYEVTTWGSHKVKDDSRAFTLYDADEVDEQVLNTVRGLSGDGAISDSYAIPVEAVTVTKTGSEITKLVGKMLTITTLQKLEIDFSDAGWTPKNEAIKGMFRVTFMSMQEKNKMSFPAWDLKDSVNEWDYITVNLWCDPKPSGAPYCCPTQVVSLHPASNDGIIRLATLEAKSVRGGQWLRNPLIYSTARGEIFSTMETQLQREFASYEQQMALHQLELSRREREIRIAQSDYSYQSGLASSIIGSGISLLSGDFGTSVSNARNALDTVVSQQFTKQMQDLQAYEQNAERALIGMAYSNNLKNLNLQETIRRVAPREVVFAPNESLGSFEQYNGFTISITVPDMEYLKSKDMEYSKYGYPVYEAVTNFVMTNNLRTNHTVYQFENPLIELGGKHGNMVRAVLESGIRILSNKYTSNNIINNPKRS